MTSTPKFDHDRSKPQDRDATLGLVLSMADTTWRMFTPAIILVPLGLWADSSWGTKPWLTLLSVPVALALAGLLVKRQLRKGD